MAATMSLARRVGSAFRWTAAGRLGAQLISWVGTLFVMRLLAPSDYGLAAICASVIAIVSMVDLEAIFCTGSEEMTGCGVTLEMVPLSTMTF